MENEIPNGNIFKFFWWAFKEIHKELRYSMSFGTIVIAELAVLVCIIRFILNLLGVF